MCLSVTGWGQTVDGRDITADSMVQYLEIYYSGNFVKNKPVVIVDYGQEIKSTRADTRVAGPDGKPVLFNSVMDAVNRFHYWGWELMSVHAISTGTGGGNAYYVLRRRGR